MYKKFLMIGAIGAFANFCAPALAGMLLAGDTAISIADAALGRKTKRNPAGILDTADAIGSVIVNGALTATDALGLTSPDASQNMGANNQRPIVVHYGEGAWHYYDYEKGRYSPFNGPSGNFYNGYYTYNDREGYKFYAQDDWNYPRYNNRRYGRA